MMMDREQRIMELKKEISNINSQLEGSNSTGEELGLNNKKDKLSKELNQLVCDSFFK